MILNVDRHPVPDGTVPLRPLERPAAAKRHGREETNEQVRPDRRVPGQAGKPGAVRRADRGEREGVGRQGARLPQFDVLRAIDDPCRVALYEVYDSEDAFKAHLEQAHTKAFLGQVKELVTKQSVLKLARTVAPAKGA